MSKATDAGQKQSGRGHQPRRTPAGLSPGLSQLVALLLVLALAGAVALLVVQVRTYNRNQTAQEDANAAKTAAEQFALRMDNFNPQNLDTYGQRVSALLTTRARGQFKGSFPTFQQLYKRYQAVGTGTVKAAGLQNVDPDSATVLVIHDRLVRSKAGTQQQYLRWTVDLDKVDGRWLVDKFSQD